MSLVLQKRISAEATDDPKKTLVFKKAYNLLVLSGDILCLEPDLCDVLLVYHQNGVASHMAIKILVLLFILLALSFYLVLLKSIAKLSGSSSNAFKMISFKCTSRGFSMVLSSFKWYRNGKIPKYIGQSAMVSLKVNGKAP